MIYIDRFVGLLTAFLIPATLSCGGGDNLVAGGGIGGTGVHSVGEVTAIGSIWVNSVIQSIDDDTIKLTVLDQIVIVNDHTQLKNAVSNTLAAGDIVDIAGYSDDTGVIFRICEWPGRRNTSRHSEKEKNIRFSLLRH